MDIESNPTDMPAAPALRRNWALTQEAFDKLLTSFGEDRDSAAKKYLEIRKAGEYELVLKGVTGQGKTEEIGYFNVLKK